MKIVERLFGAGFRHMNIPVYENALCVRRGDCAAVLGSEKGGGLCLQAPPVWVVEGNLGARIRRGEREVIALCVWSDLDYATAARALGVPVGTVRSRLSRARRKLRRLVPAGREPASGRGQVPGDRENVARPAPAGPADTGGNR